MSIMWKLYILEYALALLLPTLLVGCRKAALEPLRVVSFKSVTHKVGLYPDVPACEAVVRNSVETVTAIKDYEACEHINIGDTAEHFDADVYIEQRLYSVEHAEANRP